MNVLGRLFLNSRKDMWKDVKTEFFLWDVEELTFLIKSLIFSFHPNTQTMLEQVYVFKVDNQTIFVTTQKYKYKWLFVKLDLNKDKGCP